MISNDAGATWQHVLFPNSVVFQLAATTQDLGGPFARGRYSPVRIGSEGTPFLVATFNAVYGITPDAIARTLASTSGQQPPLVGANRDGTVLLVRYAPDQIAIIRTNSSILAPTPSKSSKLTGR